MVLRAFETGLRPNTDTEGLRGLQRAFHVAGCPNVVASLLEVDDEATAALMNTFWEKVLNRDSPLSPAQASREAQLLVATLTWCRHWPAAAAVSVSWSMSTQRRNQHLWVRSEPTPTCGLPSSSPPPAGDSPG